MIMSKFFEIIKLVIPALIVIVGWWVISCLSQKNDLKNKRREIITGYIIEAYQNIEDCCGRQNIRQDTISRIQKDKFEKAIANI